MDTKAVMTSPAMKKAMKEADRLHKAAANDPRFGPGVQQDPNTSVQPPGFLQRVEGGVEDTAKWIARRLGLLHDQPTSPANQQAQQAAQQAAERKASAMSMARGMQFLATHGKGQQQEDNDIINAASGGK